MSESSYRTMVVVLGVVGLVLGALSLPLHAGDRVVGHLTVALKTTVDGAAAVKATTVLSGSEVVTGPGGTTQLTTRAGDRVNFGPDTNGKVEQEQNQTLVHLRRGRVAVHGSTTEVRLRCASVLAGSPMAALWEVGLVDEKAAEIVALEGPVQIRLPDHTVVVYRGERVTLDLDSSCSLRRLALGPRGPGASAGLSRAEEIAVALGATATFITGAVAASNAVHPDPVSPSGL